MYWQQSCSALPAVACCHLEHNWCTSLTQLHGVYILYIVLQDDCISACNIARLVIQLSTHLLSSHEPILKVVLPSREHSFYGLQFG